MLKGRTIAIAVAVAIATTGPAAARADDPAPDEPAPDATADATPEPAPRRVRPLAVAASIVPGVLVAGSGHYVAGDRDTAKKLLRLQGYGLGMAVGAAIPLGLTASARQISGPLIPFTVIGTSMWLSAWVADVFGTTGLARITGGPRAPARLELEAGYAYVIDPRFEHASFSIAEADAWFGSLRLSPSTWIATGADNQRARAEVGYRLRGPAAGASTAGDGSFFDVDAAVTYHRYGDERFSVTTAEAAVETRYDMARITPALGGAFLELGVGLGVDVTNYYTTDAERDVSDLLLSRGAFGMYVPRGELRLGYDHRRDTLAGGFATPAQTNGFLGFFHIDTEQRITDRWSLSAGVLIGSAYIGQLGLRYRGGP